jgi:hypothetical protein
MDAPQAFIAYPANMHIYLREMRYSMHYQYTMAQNGIHEMNAGENYRFSDWKRNQSNREDERFSIELSLSA